ERRVRLGSPEPSVDRNRRDGSGREVEKVVFDAQADVPRQQVFPAEARGPPAHALVQVARGDQLTIEETRRGITNDVGAGPAALGVEQRVIPREAELGSRGRLLVDLGQIIHAAEARRSDAGVDTRRTALPGVAIDVGGRERPLEAEDQLVELPAIAEL